MPSTPASYFIRDLPDHHEINTAIKQQFCSQVDHQDTVKTHYFAGRYENIYLGLDKVPALQFVIEQARQFAAEILGSTAELHVGFWFNAMAPGDTTTLHTHDDDDECLSAVYYIDAPEGSGNLIVHIDNERVSITPQTSRFVFFYPNVPHEVAENTSKYNRLSIGMNFGMKQS